MDSRFSSISSTSASTYSHLLYLKDHERSCYLSGPISPNARHESLSFFSMTSSRSSEDSDRSDASILSSRSTGDLSLSSATLPCEKFAENHYPLITSLDPSQSLNLRSGPPRHFAMTVARQLVAIHNSFIRALNSSYNHAPGVEPGTVRCRDFLRFNQTLLRMLDLHLQTEEDFLSSAFRRWHGHPRGTAEKESHEQHYSFTHGLRIFQQYIFDERNLEEFDGLHFRKLVGLFAPGLVQRLHSEIPTVLSLRFMDSTRVRKLWSRIFRGSRMFRTGEHEADPHIFVPFFLGCQDREYLLDGEPVQDYPGFPWFVEVLLRKWLARKHAGVWEFLPSDLHGVKRTLVA